MYDASMDRNEYKSYRKQQVADALAELAQYPTLRNLFNAKWATRVCAGIDSIRDDSSYDGAVYYAFTTLADWGPPLWRCLEDRLQALSRAASAKSNNLRDFRLTEGRLATLNDAGSWEGTVFEVLTLGTVAQYCSKNDISFEPYVGLPGTRKNIEGRFWANSRWCNVEVKGLGPSKHDIGGRRPRSGVWSGFHSVPMAMKQVTDAVDGKWKDQLRHVPADEPAVLFLCLGRNADNYTSQWALDEHLPATLVAGVLRFGSFLSIRRPTLFANPSAPVQLNSDEHHVLTSAEFEVGTAHADDNF